ncbi:MAG: hypothetical protein LUG98_03790 [Tannerellaceae bacterium]|nr:hypothetical protein [Tannerellaceae bacterium]
MRFLLDFNENGPELTEQIYEEYLALEDVSYRIVCLSEPFQFLFHFAPEICLFSYTLFAAAR